MLFLGAIEGTIDSKGRTSVPVEFRHAVPEGIYAGVVLYRSFTAKCIEGCTMDRMEKISDAADTMDLFGSEAQSINSLIFSDARSLQFDSAGRIVVPADLLAHAGINGKALFVGRGKTFQIWNAADFKEQQELDRTRAQRERPSLVIPKN
ncbi:MAG: division/cell wall cluster transcriptional repressor MraZ [Alphaproteobacteria bacterium]|nr:division/cell wall cluster transcriptional repressor MraZ [Alphaproteobacteria bacterium]